MLGLILRIHKEMSREKKVAVPMVKYYSEHFSLSLRINLPHMPSSRRRTEDLEATQLTLSHLSFPPN
jgi:hypothetical protein